VSVYGRLQAVNEPKISTTCGFLDVPLGFSRLRIRPAERFLGGSNLTVLIRYADELLK
jgi:hypothetical protein